MVVSGRGVQYQLFHPGFAERVKFGLCPGGPIGAIIKPHKDVSIGLTYTTPQDVNHHKVLQGVNLNDFSTTINSLALSSPNNLGVGVGWEAIPRKLLFETDFKWLNWANADGYRQFDWKDQYVFGIGGQFKPIPKLALRLGYNYGNNPVKPHNNFVGATGRGSDLYHRSRGGNSHLLL